LSWYGFLGFISIFTKELCFCGWVLNTLKSKVGSFLANIIQAAIFTLTQLGVAFMILSLPIVFLDEVVYAFFTIGLINDWISMKAGAILPNLITYQ